MKHSLLRGHKIEWDENEREWVYSDTKESTIETWGNRRCGNCNQNWAEDHDACLGILPGVMNACCGHGIISDAYVQFLDGNSIHGKAAKIVQKQLTRD